MSNLLREADPAREHVLPSTLDDRAIADLSVILGDGFPVGREPRAPASRRRVRRGLVAAAAAAVLVAGGITVGTILRPPAVQAAPVALPVLAVAETGGGAPGERLRSLATTALASGASDRSADAGTSASFRYRGWSFNARIDGRTTQTAIVATDTTVTRDADGSVTRTVTVASIDYPTAQSRAAWEADAPVAVGDVVARTTLPAGASTGLFSGPVPKDATSMRAYLAQGHPIDAYGAGELVVAVTDLAQERHLSGAETAAVLDVMAAESGVVELGRVRDRAGRAGVAFAADGSFSGLPTRYVLVVDPDTGRILASETWLTRSAGQLGISVPAATDYRLFDMG